MKQTILLILFLLLAHIVHAQTEPDTTLSDQPTVEQLLQRIETLEHKVAVQDDINSLSHIIYDCADKLADIRHHSEDESTLSEWVESEESVFHTLSNLICQHIYEYDYTPEELDLIAEQTQLIESYFDIFRQWLKQ